MDPATPFDAALAAARGGDVRAVELLAERFYPTVRRLVHHRLETDLRASRPWLAARFSTADVVQEVFLGVLRDLSTFAGTSESAFVGYLAMVVRNRVVDAVRFHGAERRDGRRISRIEDRGDLPGHAVDPAAGAAGTEQLERLDTALQAFEPRERLLLRARIEELATFQELADQLGYASESGARRAYYAAKARLALAMKER